MSLTWLTYPWTELQNPEPPLASKPRARRPGRLSHPGATLGIRGRASKVVVTPEATARPWRADARQPSRVGSRFSWLRNGTKPLMIATRRSEATLRATRRETTTERELVSMRGLGRCRPVG